MVVPELHTYLSSMWKNSGGEEVQPYSQHNTRCPLRFLINDCEEPTATKNTPHTATPTLAPNYISFKTISLNKKKSGQLKVLYQVCIKKNS